MTDLPPAGSREGSSAATEHPAHGDSVGALERILDVLEWDDSEESKLAEIQDVAYWGLARRPPWSP